MVTVGMLLVLLVSEVASPAALFVLSIVVLMLFNVISVDDALKVRSKKLSSEPLCQGRCTFRFRSYLSRDSETVT